ncbi:hypothetical protein ACJBU6_04650 [Exserohilum turcicum]
MAWTIISRAGGEVEKRAPSHDSKRMEAHKPELTSDLHMGVRAGLHGGRTRCARQTRVDRREGQRKSSKASWKRAGLQNKVGLRPEVRERLGRFRATMVSTCAPAVAAIVSITKGPGCMHAESATAATAAATSSK